MLKRKLVQPFRPELKDATSSQNLDECDRPATSAVDLKSSKRCLGDAFYSAQAENVTTMKNMT